MPVAACLQAAVCLRTQLVSWHGMLAGSVTACTRIHSFQPSSFQFIALHFVLFSFISCHFISFQKDAGQAQQAQLGVYRSSHLSSNIQVLR